MSDADQYRAKASQAERLGLAMSTLVNRDQLLEIARGWRDLAERLTAVRNASSSSTNKIAAKT